MRYLPYLILITIVLLGIISNSWFLTTFRSRVGSSLFFLNVLISIVIFAAIIQVLSRDYTASTKALMISGMVAVDAVVTILMYKGKA
jgi:hypothetical protein